MADIVNNKNDFCVTVYLFCFFLSVICLLVLYVLSQLKGNAQFAQKVTFEPFMDFKQNHY